MGFGVAAKVDLSASSCFALMVVRGPLRFPPKAASRSSSNPKPKSFSDSVKEKQYQHIEIRAFKIKYPNGGIHNQHLVPVCVILPAW